MGRPTIKTKRLQLRSYYAGDVTDKHVDWLNDSDVVRYSEQRHKFHTLESVHKYVNEINHSAYSYIWGIWEQPDNWHSSKEKLIGTITAHIDTPNGVANVGIMIGDVLVWGHGYGAEAWNAVCNWLFDFGVRKIEMGCHHDNIPMRGVAEKCGMRIEGVRRDHFIVNGEPQDLLLYAKMRPVKESVSHEGAGPESVPGSDSLNNQEVG